MSVATIRAAIKTQIAAVSGIGVVFKSRRHTETWPDFLSRFVASGTSRVNVTFFWRGGGSDGVGSIGSEDARGLLEYTEQRQRYRIVHIYGFEDADDDATPSEDTFSNTVEAIENKFRFLQDLSGTSFKSEPVQLLESDLRMFGDVLCHYAMFELVVVVRQQNPNAEE